MAAKKFTVGQVAGSSQEGGFGAKTGAIIVVKRKPADLRLNPHFHLLSRVRRLRSRLIRTVAQSYKRKEPVSREKSTRYVGFDVGSEKIAVAIAEPDGIVGEAAWQLPTDHGHDGGPQARSANIRVINRRASPSTAASPMPRVRRNGGDNNGRAR